MPHTNAGGKLNSVTHIEMPYLGVDGSPTGSTRRRHAMTQADGKRFSWKKGSTTLLYGMQKLEEIHRLGWVLLVEGETDTLTGWQAGIPTLGIPGKATWKPEWAELLYGLEVVLWVEPDAESLVSDVMKTIPDLKVIQAVPPIKDINQALTLGMDVAQVLKEAREHSLSATGFFQQLDQELTEKARLILESRDPLERVREAISAGGYGGDISKPLIVYLALTSRLIKMGRGAMPVHMLLSGESSAGKSFIVSTASKLFPMGAVSEIQAGSPRALIYGNYPTQHAAIIFGEADSLPASEDNPAASAIRSLLQENVLKYDVTVSQKDGELHRVESIVKEGPTVLITTATKFLGDQLMTRLFNLDISGGDEQNNRSLDKIVENHLNGTTEPPEELLDFQQFLQSRAPWDVSIPFSGVVSEGLPRKKVASRLLRDLHRLISLIQSVAILRHSQRHIDDHGRIVADIEDYETVYELVNPMYIDTVTGVTPAVTAVVDAVMRLKREIPEAKIGYAALERELEMHREQVRRNVLKAVGRGWLVDRETKERSPRDLILGDPIPSDTGLPTPESIRHAVTGLTD